MYPNPSHPLKSILARIYSPSQNVVGGGFLIATDLICTCAHVVNLASNRKSESQDQPPDLVTLDFPFLQSPLQQAVIVAWFPITPDGGGDIALLRCLRPLPIDAIPPILYSIGSSSIAGRAIKTYGFPDNIKPGINAEGYVGELRTNGSIQLEQYRSTGATIKPGFSGSPVWDTLGSGVIGMVVESVKDTNAKVSTMLPLQLIVGACQGVVELAQVELLPLPIDQLHSEYLFSSDSESFHYIHPLALQRFAALTGQQEWDSDQLWDLYAASKPVLSKSRAEFSSAQQPLEVLATIIKYLNGLIVVSGIPPIFNFLHRLSMLIADGQVRLAVQRWIETTAASLNVPTPTEIVSPTPSRQSYLLIKIDKDVTLDTFQVQAYLWQHTGPYVSLDIGSFDSSYRYRLGDIPVVLTTLLDTTLGSIKRKVTPNDIIIEWLIPSELLGEDIDHWNSDSTDEEDVWPVGHRHPVVVRLLERLHARWAVPWNDHRAWFLTLTQRSFEHVTWVCPDDECASAVLSAKLVTPGSCLALEGALDQLTSRQRAGMLKAMLRSGTSVAFFPRRRCASDVVRTSLEDLVNTGGGLLGEIRTKRAQAREHEPLYAMTILWDDPNRPLISEL